jgi:isoleucyl-tRNA synthetase
LAKNLVGKQFGKGFYESKDLTDFENYKEGDKIPYQILAECKGAGLVGRYEQLLPFIALSKPENAFRVISGDFVTIDDRNTYTNFWCG